MALELQIWAISGFGHNLFFHSIAAQIENYVPSVTIRMWSYRALCALSISSLWGGIFGMRCLINSWIISCGLAPCAPLKVWELWLKQVPLWLSLLSNKEKACSPSCDSWCNAGGWVCVSGGCSSCGCKTSVILLVCVSCCPFKSGFMGAAFRFPLAMWVCPGAWGGRVGGDRAAVGIW